MSVVVGVDGSQESWAALSWAGDAARQRSTGLTVVIAEHDLAPHEDGADTSPESVAVRASELEPTAAVRVVAGTAEEVLTAAAEDADLVVIGSRGLSRIRALISDSVAEDLLGRLDTPLVLVRQPAAADTGRVVVGVDEKTGTQVLTFAFAEAQRRGADLRVVSTWERQILNTIGANAFANDDISASVEAELEAMLIPFQEQYPSVTVTTLVEFGDPAASLAQESLTADLVVVGAHGQSGLLRILTGSTTQDVIHLVTTPVAVISVSDRA
ncbi:universal stress protein [Nakamurella silvestris]|nr:universal stress protein [Nakamurella silvestris]